MTTTISNVIRYLSEVEGLVPWTWWPHEEVGHTDEAKKEVHAIYGKDEAFDTPKPVRLMKRVVQLGTKADQQGQNSGTARIAGRARIAGNSLVVAHTQREQRRGLSPGG